MDTTLGSSIHESISYGVEIKLHFQALYCMHKGGQFYMNICENIELISRTIFMGIQFDILSHVLLLQAVDNIEVVVICDMAKKQDDCCII